MDKEGVFEILISPNAESARKCLNAFHKTFYVKVLTTCVDVDGNFIHTLYLKPRLIKANVENTNPEWKAHD